MKARRKIKKVKPRWMIKEPSGEFWTHSERTARWLCIKDALRDCQAPHRDPPYTPTWDDLKSEGYRCVRVEIRQVSK